MGLYEHTFLVRQDATQAQVDALLEQYTAVLTAGGAKVEKVENWGIKSLTFRMKKNRKAFFTFLNMSISEDVIRYFTVAVEELEEGPSAMMRRRDDRKRDDDMGFSMDEVM
jgi:small subunit ribosomal protein S6